MIIHHIVTISLISFSYVCGFVRIGTLVLLVHDASDVLLEAGKICNYLGGPVFRVLSDVIFAVFTVVFAISRSLFLVCTQHTLSHAPVPHTHTHTHTLHTHYIHAHILFLSIFSSLLLPTYTHMHMHTPSLSLSLALSLSLSLSLSLRAVPRCR